MNWGYAKNVIIWVYIILNIFLITIFYKNNTRDNISRNTINNTIIALKKRGVLVNCEVPMYNKDTGTLSYDKFEFDRRKIVNEMFEQNYSEDNSIYVSGSKEIKFVNKNNIIYTDYNYYVHNKGKNDIITSVDKLLDEIGIKFTDKIVEKCGKDIVIYERHKKFYIFENYVKISTENNKLMIDINYRKIKDINNRKREIMPIYQVLIKNMINIKGKEIEDISFGFKEGTIGDNIKELDDIPVWRLKLGDGNYIFYRAYTGQELK